MVLSVAKRKKKTIFAGIKNKQNEQNRETNKCCAYLAAMQSIVHLPLLSSKEQRKFFARIFFIPTAYPLRNVREQETTHYIYYKALI